MLPPASTRRPPHRRSWLRPIEKAEKVQSAGTLFSQRQKRVEVVRRAPRNAHAELHHDRIVEQALPVQPLGQQKVAGVEDLDLGLARPAPGSARPSPSACAGVLVMT